MFSLLLLISSWKPLQIFMNPDFIPSIFEWISKMKHNRRARRQSRILSPESYPLQILREYYLIYLIFATNIEGILPHIRCKYSGNILCLIFATNIEWILPYIRYKYWGNITLYSLQILREYYLISATNIEGILPNLPYIRYKYWGNITSYPLQIFGKYIMPNIRYKYWVNITLYSLQILREYYLISAANIREIYYA